MKHFDTHVRLAIGWKTFRINALTYFSCQLDKSVCKADNKSLFFSLSAHHVSSYKIIHAITVSWDTLRHAEYDNVPRPRQIFLWKRVTTLLSDQNIFAPITSNGPEVWSCQLRRHPDKCGAKRERERDVKIQFQFQPQRAAETRPHKSDIFNYFIPFRVNTQQQSGPELSTPMNWD